MTKTKAIVSQSKVIQDMVAGATMEEAIDNQNQPKQQQQSGGTGMDFSVFENLVGKCVIAHTVTYAFIGRLVQVSGSILVLEEATWVADLGRIGETFNNLKFNEYETLNRTVCVAATSLVYLTELPGLPAKQKDKK